MISVTEMSWSGMIDFKTLNNNMISGLESHEIQEICDVQELLINDPSIIDETFDSIDLNIPHKDNDNDIQPEDKGLPIEIKDKMNQLRKSAIPISTAYQTKKWSASFLSFLREKGLNDNFTQMSSSLLDEYVGYFYSELRKKDGNYYSPASLNCIRASLFHYLIRPPLSLKVHIISGKDFFNSNEILKALSKKYAEAGGLIKHFEAIEEAYLKKLKTYFDRSSPEKLQEEVYVVLEYYLGLRGRECIKYLER